MLDDDSSENRSTTQRKATFSPCIIAVGTIALSWQSPALIALGDSANAALCTRRAVYENEQTKSRSTANLLLQLVPGESPK